MPAIEKQQFGDVRFISDTEPAEDALRTHKRTAAFLAEAIRGNEAIRSIALVGPWGSGKSLVVRFLADALGSPQTGDVSTSPRVEQEIPATPAESASGGGNSGPSNVDNAHTSPETPAETETAPAALDPEPPAAGSAAQPVPESATPGSTDKAPVPPVAGTKRLWARCLQCAETGPWWLRWLAGRGTVTEPPPAEPGTLLLIYDAWLHQSDSPRRSFVEVLLESLVPEGGHLLPRWSDDIDRIAGRLEVTDTTDSPVASLPMFILLLALCTGPFGTTALLRSKELAELIDASFKNTFLWGWLPTTGPTVARAGVDLLLAAPTFAVALYVVAWGVHGYRKWRAKRGHVSKSRPVDISISGVNSAVFYRKPERSRKRVIKDPAPTTLEFQKLFQDIARGLKNGESFATKGGKVEPRKEISRLVVVIDNLDRLTSEDAREIWPVIRSICLGSGVANGEQPANNGLPAVTVLAPLDTIVFSRSPEDSEPDPIRAMAHMEKSFDLIVRMPRPRLSSWQRYFADRLRFVLKDKTDGPTLQKVIGLADHHLNARQDKVTPRELNNLANRIAALWMQWGKIIELPTISGFVLDEPLIGDDLKKFFTTDGPVADVDRDWRVAYFAMYHGIEPDENLFVINEASIERCLSESNSQGWEELSLHAEFDTILLRTVAGWRTGPALSFNALLNAADFMARGSDDRFTGVWTGMPSALDHAPIERPVSAGDAGKLVTLLARSQSDAMKALSSFLKNALTRSAERQHPIEAGTKAAVALLEAAGDVLAGRNPETEAITLEGDAERIVDVLGRLSGVPRAVRFLDYAKPYDVQKIISEFIFGQRRLRNVSQAVNALLASRLDIGWDYLLVKMVDQVAANENATGVAEVLKALAAGNDADADGAPLASFMSGNGGELIEQSIEGNLPATAYAAIAMFLCVPWSDDASFGTPFSAWASQQPDACARVAGYARVLYGDGDTIRFALDRAAGAPWFAPVATAIVLTVVSDTEELSTIIDLVMAQTKALPASFPVGLRIDIAVALAARGGPPPGWVS
jgi:hypothetical protein